MFSLSDYQYDLSENAIAQIPSIPADSCSLLCCEKNNRPAINTQEEFDSTYVFQDAQFSAIADFLTPNDVLVFNNTKVIKARVPLHNVRVVNQVWREIQLEKGEIFLLQKLDDHTCECLLTLLKRTRPGIKIYIWNANLSPCSENLTSKEIDCNNTEPEPSTEIVLEITELNERGVIIKMHGCSVDDFFMNFGHLPLPPYIHTTEEKEQYYQTVFALQEGSVAAPTASLHFTNQLLETIEKKGVTLDYVTLHVWLGTFKPVETPDIRDYKIHAEQIWLSSDVFSRIASYKQDGKRIIAVGTTVARTLESLPYVWKMLKNNNDFSKKTVDFWNNMTEDISLEQAKGYILSCDEACLEYNTSENAFWCDNSSKIFVEKSDMQATTQLQITTQIFIYPWFRWRIVESLITNFHVPWSSLLMLVASAMWYENMQTAYKYALDREYRFLSFGDAMWIKQLL